MKPSLFSSKNKVIGFAPCLPGAESYYGKTTGSEGSGIEGDTANIWIYLSVGEAEKERMMASQMC